tara:strand:- start:370 stop:618 length:249 start_codon:yes stop_codon:yes gene_type:complete
MARSDYVHKSVGGKLVALSESEIDECFAREVAWEADAIPRAAKAEIERLESEVTQRRLRDAYADPTWMNAQEAKIAVERAKL